MTDITLMRDAHLAAHPKHAEIWPAWQTLYHAVNAMMAPLGYHGTISSRDDRVQAVMDALHVLDGGMTIGA